MPYSPIQQMQIKSQVETELIGREIFIYDSIPSTNDRAKQMIADWDREGIIILADSQSEGKGRLGRKWLSESEAGIYLSALVKPDLPQNQISQITLVAGVALVRAINEFSPAKAYLKWPNDILINEKKVAGILTENYQTAGHSGVIIGIGINVNHKRFPLALQHIATSLAMENGDAPDRESLIPVLIKHLDHEYRCFLKEGLSPVLQHWSMNSDMFGMHITITRGNETYPGTAQKLDELGRLVVLLDTGEEMAFDSGEVTLQT